MPRTRESTAYAQRLIKEYTHARKILRKYFKARHDPNEVRIKIKEILENTTRRQSKIIGYTLNDAFKAGAKEGDKEIGNATISASSATVGFDLTKVADTHLNKITRDTIGNVGKYNSVLTNQLQLEYNTLLADNRLVTSLNKEGWTPWLGKSLEARGVDPKVIALAKGQTTTKKIVSILETQGIRGGKNPREVSKMLIPHVQRFFGPDGVIIDHVGKFKRVLKVDADGNYKYVKQAITRPYRATPRSYSNLLARSSIIHAHHEGRYQSLQKTGLVDYYISKSILDANTCNLCATMHGQRVSHSEGPLYHPSGACRLKPIYKKDSGLKNKDPAFYENQRDQHFWKQHQLAEYNKGMPRGAKLKFHSMLPKDALTAMPDKAAMRAIRYNALGKPTAIAPSIPAIKPKAPPTKPSIIKPTPSAVAPKRTAAKNASSAQMKEEVRKDADELWVKTAKDGKEHLKGRNGKPFYVDGSASGVPFSIPNTPFTLHHTHPSLATHTSMDAPFSGGDVANFLSTPNLTRSAASSSKTNYVAIRTSKTKATKESAAVLEDKFNMMAKQKYFKIMEMEKRVGPYPTPSRRTALFRQAILETGEEFAKEYKFDYMHFTR